MSVASWCSTCFCVVLCVGFCTGHFVMVPLNLTYLHCIQHSVFEQNFNLYYSFIELHRAYNKWQIESSIFDLTVFHQLHNNSFKITASTYSEWGLSSCPSHDVPVANQNINETVAYLRTVSRHNCTNNSLIEPIREYVSPSHILSSIML